MHIIQYRLNKKIVQFFEILLGLNPLGVGMSQARFSNQGAFDRIHSERREWRKLFYQSLLGSFLFGEILKQGQIRKSIGLFQVDQECLLCFVMDKSL